MNGAATNRAQKKIDLVAAKARVARLEHRVRVLSRLAGQHSDAEMIRRRQLPQAQSGLAEARRSVYRLICLINIRPAADLIRARKARKARKAQLAQIKGLEQGLSKAREAYRIARNQGDVGRMLFWIQEGSKTKEALREACQASGLFVPAGAKKAKRPKADRGFFEECSIAIERVREGLRPQPLAEVKAKTIAKIDRFLASLELAA